MTSGTLSAAISLNDVGDYLALAGTILGAGAALLVVSAAIRGLYRRTVGRRRDRYRRLSRLGNRAQVDFFTSALGDPPVIRRNIEGQKLDHKLFQEMEEQEVVEWEDPPLLKVTYIECFWVDRDYYVQAIADEDETVLSWSVTTRSKRFKPKFIGVPKPSWRARRRLKKEVGVDWKPHFTLREGQTRFAELAPDGGVPQAIRVSRGARTYAYSEIYYFGNPGYYQHFVFTASGAAGRFPTGRIGEVWDETGERWPDDPYQVEASAPFEQLKAVAEFREQTVVTTYTVVSIDLPLEFYPSEFGPFEDWVRTLP